MGHAWPFVGRDDELELVRAAVRDGRSAVVTGAAGVGKSRVLEAFCADAGDGSTIPAIAASASARAIPLGALTPLLSTSPPADPTLPGLYSALLGELRARCPGEPILAIDDAQHLDDSSLALVHWLATTGGVRVVCTVRSTDPIPDAITALWTSGRGERIELQPLAKGELDLVTELALDGPVEPFTLDQLWRRTEGNPLFLRLVIASGVDAGELRQEAGWWTWGSPVAAGGEIAEVVEGRLAGLSRAEREALEVVALGEPIDRSVVAAIAPEADLRLLEQQGLIAVDEDEVGLVLRMAHPLYGEVLRSRSGRLGREATLLALADAVIASGAPRPGDPLRVATWRTEAGAPSEPTVLVAAAEEASDRFDFALAARLASEAVAAGGEYDARWAQARALVGLDRPFEAEELLAELAASAPDDQARVRVAEARSEALFWKAGEAEQAVLMLEAVEAELDDPAGIERLQANRARVLANAGRPIDALAVGRDVLGAQDADTRIKAVSGVGFALAIDGHGSEALELVNMALPDALGHADTVPDGPGWVFTVWLVALLGLGRLADADRLMAILPQDDAQATYTGAAVIINGRMALYRGRAGEAVGWFRRSARELADTSASWRPWSLSLLAEAHALRGEEALARQALEEARRGWRTLAGTWLMDARRAAAWVSAATGEVSRARDEALAVADECRGHGNSFFEAFALHDAARFGARRQASERLGVLASACDGEWYEAFAAHASATTGPELERAADLFEGIGAALHAAEAILAASAAYEQEGLKARAAAAASRGAVLWERCERARTPALLAVRTEPVLTPREREIAVLAARGRSNKEIADALVLSVRTVEGHVLRACAKLGAANRTELASLLGDQ